MASPPQGLHALAPELVIDIARHLWLGDMSRLAQANRRLHQILDPFLYLTDAQPYNQYALYWAAEHNLPTVAERAVRAGTPAQPANPPPSPLRPFGQVLMTEEAMKAAAARATPRPPPTPLSMACAAGHTKVVTLLLRKLPSMACAEMLPAVKQAAINGRVETMALLLEYVERTSRKDAATVVEAAFVAAAKAGQRAVLQQLLETKDGPVAVDKSAGYYNDSMMKAAGAGHDEVWDLLSSIQPLDKIDLEQAEQTTERLFMILGMEVTGQGSRGIVELIERCISLGLDVKHPGVRGALLAGASYRQNIPLTELLLDYSSNEQNDREELLRSPANDGRLELYKMLLTRGVRTSVWEEEFVCSLQQGRVVQAELLLSFMEKDSKIFKERYEHVLLESCAHGSFEVLQSLLSSEMAPEVKTILSNGGLDRWPTTLLQSVAHREREEERLKIARVILDAGADPNKCKEGEGATRVSPLRQACREGLAKMAQLFLEHGAHHDEVSPNGFSILHQACSDNLDIGLIEDLLKRGADVMATTGGGETPLHQVCLSREEPRNRKPSVKYEVAKLLISHGADPNARTVAGATPLHFACSNRPYTMSAEDANVVLALLEHGVDIEQRSSGHKTPLLIACSTFNHRVASILLAKGAEVSTQNLSGFGDRCPSSDVDLDCFAVEMMKLLLAHGADKAMVRQTMLPALNERGCAFEAMRMLLMQGAGADKEARVYLTRQDGRSRTEALGAALGMVVGNVSLHGGMLVMTWPAKKERTAPKVADEDEDMLYY